MPQGDRAQVRHDQSVDVPLVDSSGVGPQFEVAHRKKVSTKFSQRHIALPLVDIRTPIKVGQNTSLVDPRMGPGLRVGHLMPVLPIAVRDRYEVAFLPSRVDPLFYASTSPGDDLVSGGLHCHHDDLHAQLIHHPL